MNKKPAAKSVTSKKNESAFTKRIYSTLKNLGIPSDLKGCAYITEAILFLYRAKIPCNITITGDIYPYLATKFETTKHRVERAMRHSIEVSADRSDETLWEDIFSNSISDKRTRPTNSEFIFGVYDYLMLPDVTE